MLCPKCKTEMRIKATRYVTENDDTAEAKTQLFIEHDLVCRNKSCDNFDKVVETSRSEIQLSV